MLIAGGEGPAKGVSLLIKSQLSTCFKYHSLSLYTL